MKLNHFTSDCNLVRIFQEGSIYPGSNVADRASMTRGVPVVWLAEKPDDSITDADVQHWRDRGHFDLVAQHPLRRRYVYGGCKHPGHGVVRITLTVSKRDRGIIRFSDWLRDNRDPMTHLWMTVSMGPERRAERWRIALGAIPIVMIDRVESVGPASLEYLQAVQQIGELCAEDVAA
jgi:hypothetical protein